MSTLALPLPLPLLLLLLAFVLPLAAPPLGVVGSSQTSANTSLVGEAVELHNPISFAVAFDKIFAAEFESHWTPRRFAATKTHWNQRLLCTTVAHQMWYFYLLEVAACSDKENPTAKVSYSCNPA
jgi:hypothetical protein